MYMTSNASKKLSEIIESNDFLKVSFFVLEGNWLHKVAFIFIPRNFSSFRQSSWGIKCKFGGFFFLATINRWLLSALYLLWESFFLISIHVPRNFNEIEFHVWFLWRELFFSNMRKRCFSFKIMRKENYRITLK